MEQNIFIISGPSGCGKGTVVEGLLKESEINLYWAKSYTTRPERESDKSESHYIFVDKKKFQDLEKNGEVLESNFYNGHWYGSSKSEIDNALANGKNALKEIEVNGAFNLKKQYPDAVLIFITTSLDNIKSRLTLRGQNTPEEINERLAIARREIEASKNYDYVVENPEGHPEKAIKKIENIIKEKTNG